MVRRILPQTSRSQLAVPVSSNWLKGCELPFGIVVVLVPVPVVPVVPVVVPVPVPVLVVPLAEEMPLDAPRERVACAVAPMEGKSWARAALTTAIACRHAASDCLRVWLET